MSQAALLPDTMLEYQTDEPLPSVTAPIKLALGAINTASSYVGAFPSSFTAVVGMGTAGATREAQVSQTIAHARGQGAGEGAGVPAR